MSAVKQSLIDLSKYLKAELQKELLLQKHKATSKLLNSIDIVVEDRVDRIVLEESHIKYGDYVDRGRRPGLPDKSSRGAFIAALQRWVIVKRFTTDRKEAKSIAFAIRASIFKNGIGPRPDIAPRRQKWLTGTIERNTDRIEAAVEPAMLIDLNVIIDDILAKTNAEIKAQN